MNVSPPPPASGPDSEFDRDEKTSADRSSTTVAVSVTLAVSFLVLATSYGVAYLFAMQTTPGVQLVYQVDDPSLVPEVIRALTARLDGIAGVDARLEMGDSGQVKVLIPSRDPETIDRTKKLIQATGVMRFHVLANRYDHNTLITLAREQAQQPQSNRSREVRDADGQIVGRWVTVAELNDPDSGQRRLRVNVARDILRDASTNKLIDLPSTMIQQGNEQSLAAWLDDQSIQSVDVLVSVEPDFEVRGDHLTFAALTFDQNGEPAIALTFGPEGSGRFFALTTTYAPTGNRQRQLGIILDDQLLSAPTILSPIRSEARITGQFTREEVDRMVQILKAGRLPTDLSEQPKSEKQVDVPSRLAEFF